MTVAFYEARARAASAAAQTRRDHIVAAQEHMEAWSAICASQPQSPERTQRLDVHATAFHYHEAQAWHLRTEEDKQEACYLCGNPLSDLGAHGSGYFACTEKEEEGL